jgi:hypothetical protein
MYEYARRRVNVDGNVIVRRRHFDGPAALRPQSLGLDAVFSPPKLPVIENRVISFIVSYYSIRKSRHAWSERGRERERERREEAAAAWVVTLAKWKRAKKMHR